MNTLLKKSSIFANLLMEKPDNSFAIVKMWKKHLKKKHFKKRICIFTEKFSLGQFSVPACANQPPGFSVRGTSTPNGLFQTIKILMGYTKRLHQLKHGILFHLNSKILNFLLTIEMSYFLFFRYMKISQSTIT